MQCERCEKDFDQLVTRQGFCMTYFVEWICEGCFLDLEKVSFKEYTEEIHYGQEDV